MHAQTVAHIKGSGSLPEARRHAAMLQRLTAATRASLEQHVHFSPFPFLRNPLPCFACRLSCAASTRVR